MKSGKKISPSSRRSLRSQLGRRDRSILSDVIRYRLTTNEFLFERYFKQLQPNAVAKISARLVRQGWLMAYPLIDRQQYFVAGLTLVKAYGLPASRTRPLGPQALLTHFAIAKYCFTSGLQIRFVEDTEFPIDFPTLAPQSHRGIHVIESTDGVTTFRNVRVDLGGTPEHVTRKCVADLATRQNDHAFNRIVADKRFVAVVLTATPAKQNLIQRALSKRTWPKGMRFQVYVIPELGLFLPST